MCFVNFSIFLCILIYTEPPLPPGVAQSWLRLLLSFRFARRFRRYGCRSVTLQYRFWAPSVWRCSTNRPYSDWRKSSSKMVSLLYQCDSNSILYETRRAVGTPRNPFDEPFVFYLGEKTGRRTKKWGDQDFFYLGAPSWRTSGVLENLVRFVGREDVKNRDSKNSVTFRQQISLSTY